MNYKKYRTFFLVFLIIVAFGSGIFQYIKTFQSEIAKAYDGTKPNIGHSWSEMQCTSDLCIDDVSHEVGIGTDNPTEKLEVTGNVKASGSICGANGCVGEFELGTASTTCDSSTKTLMRYDLTSNQVEFCNGTGWQVLDSISKSYVSTCISGNGLTCTESTVGASAVYKYTLSGTPGAATWKVPYGVTSAEYIVVGGGGGGGGYGGGGGAGGVLTGTISVNPGSFYEINVGAGGAGGPGEAYPGATGSNSVFGSINAYGGGGGGSWSDTVSIRTGKDGGSGGGGAMNRSCNAMGVGGNGLTGQGYAGGNSTTNLYTNGGGGGAGGVGGTATSSSGGAGGTGVASSITGTSLYYGGGGGGGSLSAEKTGGAGGTGGGGAGGGAGEAGSNGVANTGGGGGGGGWNGVGYGGGAGGSGVVIIKFTKP